MKYKRKLLITSKTKRASDDFSGGGGRTTVERFFRSPAAMDAAVCATAVMSVPV